jgi:hypothetical protein
MLVRLRFRTIADSEQGERVLDRAVPGYTVLPGGVLAVPDSFVPAAEDALNQAGLEFRVEPVEEFLGGRHPDETRDEGEPFYDL